MRVVDASVLCGLLLGDVSVPLHAPMLVEVETLNALRGLARGRTVDPALADLLVEDLGAVPLVLYPHDVLRERVWELRHDLGAAARAALGAARVQYV